MYTTKDIILAVDYHDNNLTIRWLNCHTGEERQLSRQTTADNIRQLAQQAADEAAQANGRAIWIMESTTGWARVGQLIGNILDVRVANVLQMPLPPKAYRRKTDKIDTGRILRECLNGSLPLAHQPTSPLRALRRLVAARENLVARRTAVRNWIDRYLAHETWHQRTGLWSNKGMQTLRRFADACDEPDKTIIHIKLTELQQLAQNLIIIEKSILEAYQSWPQAQRLDQIYGIAPISAVSILARIWPIHRFACPEQLIAYAGMAPGIQSSDQTIRLGHIGGGGTDKHLRHYIIEATIWARQIPRYRPTYLRTKQRRGKKIARLVVGRLLLRSIYYILSNDQHFNPLPRKVS
jgi:transposase